MKNTRAHNYQPLLSKWLLAAVLLLSFFSFSGFVVQTQQKPYAPQTTWVQSSQNRVAKSITYKRALSHTHNRLTSFSSFILSSINLSEMYTSQIKAQMIDRCNPDISGLSTLLFHQRKTIPKNTSDDPAIALI